MKMKKYPYIVYIIYIICLPLLPILDIVFMNIGSASEQEIANNVDIGPLRRFLGTLASLGIVKDVAIYILLGIFIFIGIIMSFIFLASKKVPDISKTRSLAKLNLATQIINTIVVSILSIFSVLFLLTIFTFAISFVLWIVLACLAITGGIQTLPLYNDLRRNGRITTFQQVLFTLMGGFFYLALIAAIAGVFCARKSKDPVAIE
ncbi:MAG: hypothetical protein J6U23_06010 [Clostridiales bacterium]|nr:hypothetical protein [Clostridiales bacterium]